jgi:hypothetical protein
MVSSDITALANLLSDDSESLHIDEGLSAIEIEV